MDVVGLSTIPARLWPGGCSVARVPTEPLWFSKLSRVDSRSRVPLTAWRAWCDRVGDLQQEYTRAMPKRLIVAVSRNGILLMKIPESFTEGVMVRHRSRAEGVRRGGGQQQARLPPTACVIASCFTSFLCFTGNHG